MPSQDLPQNSEIRTMESVNRVEIDRLRDRVHDHGNLLTEHTQHFLRVEGSVEDLGQKLDAIHRSIKRELGEIKAKQDKTNGRVTELERTTSMLKGGLIVVSAGLPFVLFALSQLLGR